MATTLQAEKREKSGKYIAFALRKIGKIPAVAYGPALKENLNLAVNQKELNQILASGVRLLDLDIGGQKQMAVIKDIQHATIGNDILHADFRAINDDTKLHLTVEVTLKGEAAGSAQTGALIEQNLHRITIECLPKDLPAEIVLDISKLEVGNVWFVSDLPQLPKVRYVTHAEVPVVSCRLKTEEVEKAPAEAAPAEGDAAKTDAAAKPDGAAKVKDEKKK
ncbi:50S ribosomal protein L25 [Planctomycetales bacterium]|nr:50S ribosomal protein L25 [Planctomycetales bacterium]GHV21375.1 50S ribosomal protein L25 [Planctomycetales bacterium]